MKFLKINVKVLLILCLFSGILFLSTGCDDNKDKEKEDNKSGQVDNKPDDNTGDNGTGDGTPDGTATTENGNDSTNNVTTTNTKDTTDYSVWVANTTINTDKNQRSYKVIWGDTLWLISTAWEVPYQEIARYNHIPNPDLIYVDQIIYNPLFK